MDIQHGKGAFFIERDGKRIAEMTYSRRGDEVVIEHTGVDGSLRGQGIARQLVEKGVEWARAEKIRVRPVCPYAKKIIDETPEFQDVL